jgi:hypothetical protein
MLVVEQRSSEAHDRMNDRETGRKGERETGRQGRQGDRETGETGRQGDREKGRQGDRGDRETGETTNNETKTSDHNYLFQVCSQTYYVSMTFSVLIDMVHIQLVAL